MKPRTQKYVLWIAVLTFLSCSQTEVNAQQKAGIGIRLMPTVSSVKMKSSSGGTVNGQAVLGYGVGGFIGFNFTEHIGIQGEIIYSSLSQKYKEQDVERRINLRYFNIPVFLSINTGRYKPVNLNIVAGPQLGISAGSHVYTTGNDTTHAIIAIRKSDLGFAYGAGLDFGLNHQKTIRLGLGFRGVLGLFDISDNSASHNSDSYYIVDQTNIKTYSIYAGLSILF